MSTRLFAFALAFAATLPAADSLFEVPLHAPTSRIDQLVFDHLRALTHTPPPLSRHPVLLRRAYLDIIGPLPTVEESRTFLAHPDRAALIDALLDREEFADYWANKWCDLLRVKAEFPINLWPN